MQNLQVPQGKFTLQRLPVRKKESLRPWDAADELLLNYLSNQQTLQSNQQLVIVNDAFGALTVPLTSYNPTAFGDSCLAFKAIDHNLELNKRASEAVKKVASDQPLEHPIDVLIIKIPKTLALLEDQLIRVRPFCHSGTKIIAAGMVKNIHTSTLSLFETIIGPTKTSLAKKKARLIFSDYNETLAEVANSYPDTFKLEGTDYEIVSHAVVFSAKRLDIGTRLLLQHLPVIDGAKRIVDLGCGNGVLGLVAAIKHEQADIIFTDESYHAIASARDTFKRAFGDSRKADFIVTDCLQDAKVTDVDLVLINPPFHQHNALSTQTAVQMFREAREVLKQGGVITVVGNRHLNYHQDLKHIYGNFVNIASNKKFVILKAVKR